MARSVLLDPQNWSPPEGAEEPREPDFYDSPFTEVDARCIVSMPEWRDYLADLNRLRRAEHRYADLEEFPFFVATAYVGGAWRHQISGLRWFRYMSALKGNGERATASPAKFGQPVKEWR